jgi:hypothetical protein
MMMKLNETTLPFLEVDCIQQFGQEKGKLIFEQAEKIYQELLNNADYRNNAAIKAISNIGLLQGTSRRGYKPK